MNPPTLLITAALLLAALVIIPGEAHSPLYSGCIHHSSQKNDADAMASPPPGSIASFRECDAACGSSSGCTYFNYNHETTECALFSGDFMSASPIEAVLVTSGVVGCSESTEDCNCPNWASWDEGCPIPFDPAVECLQERECIDIDSGMVTDNILCVGDGARDCTPFCPTWADWTGDCPIPFDPAVECQQERDCIDNDSDSGMEADDSLCIGEAARECTPFCPTWASWSDCPVPFDPAVECQLERDCIDNGSGMVADDSLCIGDAARECTPFCPTWASWSECPVPFDPVVVCQLERDCVDNVSEMVADDSLCIGDSTQDCNCPTWGSWGDRSSSTGCEDVTRECVLDGAVVAVDACLGEATQQLCTLQINVKNSLTNNILAGAEIELTLLPEMDTLTLTTDGSGNAFYLNVVIGSSYSVTISMDGFILLEDYEFTVFSEANLQQNTFLSPELAEGQSFRGVLSWGPKPNDLDSHVRISPVSSPTTDTCHMFYSNRVCNSPGTGNTIVSLDQDILSGGNTGAETITFFEVTDSYAQLIYIYNFSGNVDITLSLSGAKYIVFTQMETIVVDIVRDPALTQHYWIIGCINTVGGMSTFTTINRLDSSEPLNASECIP